jgi:hypothetical protein
MSARDAGAIPVNWGPGQNSWGPFLRLPGKPLRPDQGRSRVAARAVMHLMHPHRPAIFANSARCRSDANPRAEVQGGQVIGLTSPTANRRTIAIWAVVAVVVLLAIAWLAGAFRNWPEQSTTQAPQTETTTPEPETTEPEAQEPAQQQ